MINIIINLFKGNDEEQWRPVVGFPDYMVSDQGRVKSLKFNREKILKQRIGTNGYPQVVLYKEGKFYRKEVHRLVAEAFLGIPEDKLEVNHRNGVKTDNSLENLEWLSHAENIRHADEIGLRNIKGEKHPRAKLTTEEVLQIREMLVEGVPPSEIAEIFNISVSSIYDIKSGRSWSHVTGIKPKLKNLVKSTPITINLNIWLPKEAI
jgi:hypothetical protein